MDVGMITSATAWGGTEVNTVRMSRYLIDRGHRVTIMQAGPDVYRAGRQRGEVPTDIDLQQLPVSSSFEEVEFQTWRRILDEHPCDVFVRQKNWFALRSIGLELAVRLSGARHVVVEHHPFPRLSRSSSRHLAGLVPGLGLWWYWWRLKQFSRARITAWVADEIIACSETVRRAACEAGGHLLREIEAIHFGIDTDTVQNDEEARACYRREWDIPEAALVFGSVGRLQAVKQPTVAVELFSRFRAERPNVPAWLVLAGEGPEEEPAREAARALDVQDRCVFPGWVESSAGAFSAMDVYLMPSESEGLGMTLLEAMACRLACIAFDSGGPHEILEDPSLGWLVPAGDRRAFVDAMVEVAELEEEERRSLGWRARKHIVENFQEEEQMNRIVDRIVAAGA